MKRIISKIMLAALVIGSVPLNAGFGQTVQNGAASALKVMQNSTRSALESISRNPGWTSLVSAAIIGNALALIHYKIKTAPSKRKLESLKKSEDGRPKGEIETEEHDEKEKIDMEYWKTIQVCSGITIFAGFCAFLGSNLSKLSGWLGSKI